jgi:hypothetical protein
MYRYKAIIGGRCLQAQTLHNQRTRAKIGVQRAQPDDEARSAGLRPGPLFCDASKETSLAAYSCTKAHESQ